MHDQHAEWTQHDVRSHQRRPTDPIALSHCRGLFEASDSPRAAPVPTATPSVAEEFKCALAAPPEAKAQFFLEATVLTPDVVRFTRAVDNLILRATELSLPGGLLLVGEGGLGKSFLLERIVRRYPKTWTTTQTIAPVIYISLQDATTPDAAERAIMRTLGNVGTPAVKDRSDPRRLLCETLKSCKVRVILVDEAQKLALAKGSRNSDRAAGPLGEYFRLISDKARIAIVFAGTSVLLDLFKQDPQSKTRWIGEVVLKPHEHDQTWLALLAALSRLVPLPEPSDLCEHSEALHRATKGNLRGKRPPNPS